MFHISEWFSYEFERHAAYWDEIQRLMERVLDNRTSAGEPYPSPALFRSSMRRIIRDDNIGIAIVWTAERDSVTFEYLCGPNTRLAP